MTTQRTQFELCPTPPFDFLHTLQYFRTSPSSILEHITNDQTYYRAFSVSGQDVIVKMRDGGTPERPRLLVEIFSSEDTESVVEPISNTLRRLFLLDEDPAPFLDIAERDPVLGELMQKFEGLRPMCIADPYETLLFAVIGQQINLAFARKLKLRFVETYGRQVTHDEISCWLMPTSEQVAALDGDELHAMQFSRQKTTYIITLSEAVASGRLRLDALSEMPYQAACKYLTSFKGIGRWTAEYLLMRGFGSPDVIPAGDMGLRAIVGRRYGYGKTASEEEVRSVADVWAPRRGWAAFLLWYQLQVESLMKKV